ncbi:MAG: hypothetical protein AAF081_15295 [Actinomycetota bacterium]
MVDPDTEAYDESSNLGVRVFLVMSLCAGALITLALLNTFVFIDDCDPSENADLATKSTAELDELCGVDRDFVFIDEPRG